MAKTLEELAKEIYKEMIADGEDITEEDALEMAKMEIGAKEIKNYTQADVKKERKPRERKVDSEKAEILDYLKKGLTLAIDSTTIKVENEVKLHFQYNGSDYSVTLTKHRPPKK